MLSTLSSSADFKLWNVACVCVLCVIYFLDLLTLFVATAFAIVWTGVNYYLHRRDEDSRHRLSILGLIKRDKSKHNSTPRAAYTKTVTPASATPSRSGSASYAYPRLIPGNKFDTPSRILGNSGVDNVTHGFASPVLTSKTTFLTRSCQSTFTPNHGRKSHLDWVPAATRRHPIQQEKYSVGSYPTVCLNKSPLPLAKPFASPELISPVKVKLLPLSTPVVQSSTFGPTAASNEVDKQDPCSTESVIQALKERRKRAAAAAYQDCLDPAGSSPNLVQSSKRARRESLCLALPPFTPVVTSVGGFGPPYLGSPSKNMVVRSPMPSALVSASPEGPFKRGRLASSASPPSSLAKRHRNNAIAISYCSSRSILLQRNNQSQKRKAVALDSSPASKQTKTDDRIPKGDDDESMEKNEDSSKENDAPPGAQVSAETSESDSADASMLRNRVKSLEWSPTPKKKLVYPEHMATLKEHENDQALDKERLNRLLGSLQDFSSNASAAAATEAPVTTAQAAVPTTLAKTTSLPIFGIPISPTVSSTALIQGSATNTVSVISSPVMSVSSSASSDKPTTIFAPPASSTSTQFSSAMPTESTAAATLKPQWHIVQVWCTNTPTAAAAGYSCCSTFIRYNVSIIAFGNPIHVRSTRFEARHANSVTGVCFWSAHNNSGSDDGKRPLCIRNSRCHSTDAQPLRLRGSHHHACDDDTSTLLVWGGAASTAPAFPQSSVTSPLFPSAAAMGGQSSVAQPSGFQFGAVANGLSNGISSNTAQASAAAPQGLFKFGATTTTPAVPAFNFNASQCGASATPKPAFLNFGAPAATNSLFSIGSASSHSDRPIARPRSKRITKK